jgi:hypothetical protein
MIIQELTKAVIGTLTPTRLSNDYQITHAPVARTDGVKG